MCGVLRSVALLLALGGVGQAGANAEVAEWVRDDWTVREGLPSASLRSLGQSADGFLWAGTSRGLARFDGLTFARAYDRGALSPLSDTALEAIAESRPGVLWFASDRGGGVLRLQNGRLSSLSTANGLPHAYARALAVGPDGAVWVGTAGGLARIRERVEGAPEVTAYDSSHGLPDLNVKALAVAPDGVLWVGTARGVARAAGAGFVAEGPGDLVRALTVTRDGRVWVGTTDGGLLRHDRGGWRRFGVADGLPSAQVTALAEDGHGGVFIGTAAGLVRLVNDGWQRFGPQDPLASSPIRLIFADSEGGVWVALGGRFGLVRLRQPPFQRLTTRDGLSSDDVRSVHAAPDGGVWLGTARGLDRVSGGVVRSHGEGEGLPPEGISSAMADGRGRVWVVSVNGRLFLFEHGRARPLALTAGRVQAVFADARGPVYVASDDRLLQIDQSTTDLPLDDRLKHKMYGFHRGRSGRLYLFTNQAAFVIEGGRVGEVGRLPPLTTSVLVSIAEDPSGVVWGATESAGLVRLSGPKPRVFRIVDGLYSDRVRHLLFDDQGWLWVSSPDGLFRLSGADLDRGTLVSVVEGGTAELSVGGVEARHPAAARTSDGRLFFATARGLLAWGPIPQARSRTVRPVIEQLSVNGRPLQATGRLPLERGARVAFSFTAPVLNAPEEVRFRSRLRGLEADWVETGGERSVAYGALPAGRYVFELQASAAGGPWTGTVAPFTLEVPAALYARGWFLALCALALASGLLGLHRLRLGRARQRFEAVLEERNRIARDVHDTLAQSFVAVSVQLETARRALPEDLAGLREPLEMASQAVDAGIDDARRSVRALRTADLERSDLGTALRAAAALLSGSTPIEVVVTGQPLPLPAKVEDQLLRLGQEAMTNAVRHARARSIRVSLNYAQPARRWWRGSPKKRPALITLAVSDDGVGFSKDALPPRTHGLMGMHERARALGAALTIDSAPERGTLVQVEWKS